MLRRIKALAWEAFIAAIFALADLLEFIRWMFRWIPEENRVVEWLSREARTLLWAAVAIAIGRFLLKR
jgi:hypothetical protein